MNLTLTPQKTSCRDPDEMPLPREEQSSHSLELEKTQTAPETHVPTDDMKEPESNNVRGKKKTSVQSNRRFLKANVRELESTRYISAYVCIS